GDARRNGPPLRRGIARRPARRTLPGERAEPGGAVRAATASAPYARLERLVAEERCVILDGGVATEIERVRPEDRRFAADVGLWGTWALYQAPYAVLEVHRRYVDAGCDVISTDTWSILSAPELEQRAQVGGALTHWMDVARLGIQLARQATAAAGRADECAVAFTI